MLNVHQTPALVTVEWITKLSPLLSNSHASIKAEARPGCSCASACVNPNHIQPECVCENNCVWEIFCQELVNAPAGRCLHTFPDFQAACKSNCQQKQKISSYKTVQMCLSWKREAHLESELLVEDGVEGLPVDLGLKLLLLVRQKVDLHVRVGCASHIHSRQLCSLDDPDYELKQEEMCWLPETESEIIS